MLSFREGAQEVSYDFLLERQNLLGTAVGQVLIVFELVEVFFELSESGGSECGT
jgi:hypothetical protein